MILLALFCYVGIIFPFLEQNEFYSPYCWEEKEELQREITSPSPARRGQVNVKGPFYTEIDYWGQGIHCCLNSLGRSME